VAEAVFAGDPRVGLLQELLDVGQQAVAVGRPALLGLNQEEV
jgi:hypothetical protein